MRTAVEKIKTLRYKLCMFGILLGCDNEVTDEPMCIYCDNGIVVKNTSNVDSTLNKKYISVAYYFNSFCIAAGISRVAWIQSGENLADPLTKRLGKVSREYLLGNWTY